LYAILYTDAARRAKLRLVSTVAKEVTTKRADVLYNRVRRAIVQGELRPNQRLVEAELAEMLGVSRTPIREVLQRLALDGLVSRHRRGWIVREHSAQEIKDIYACRAALEGYAARLAAEHATDEHLAELDEILACLYEGRSRDEMVALNERFHEAIIDAAANELLAELTRRSRLYFFNRRVATLYTDEEAAYSRDQHARLIAALHARDADAAEAIAREHIATALEGILSHPEVVAQERHFLGTL
jgi:DNA-binding GntR family transcriptional regulator